VTAIDTLIICSKFGICCVPRTFSGCARYPPTCNASRPVNLEKSKRGVSAVVGTHVMLVNVNRNDRSLGKVSRGTRRASGFFEKEVERS